MTVLLWHLCLTTLLMSVIMIPAAACRTAPSHLGNHSGSGYLPVLR
jgi:hypothetical protein